MKTFHSIRIWKAVTTVILFIVLAGNAASQPQHYTSNGVAGSNSFPLNQTPGKMVQWLFAPGEFANPSPAGSGNITSFSVMISSSGSRNYTNFYIMMGQTTNTAFDSGGFYTGPLDTVYSRASVTHSGTAGQWLTIVLDVPFLFDASKSLVVQMEQCGSTGTGMSIGHTVLAESRRTWSLTNTACPWAFFNLNTSRANCGIDVSPAGSCNYSWTSQTSGTTSAFNTVKAVNNLIGWAGGAGGTIRKTIDGGVTWTDGNPNPGVVNGTVYAIESFGADTAWCTTSPAATFIYRTTNGGTNWVQVHTQTGGFWNVIKFANPTTGFIQGDPVGGRWSLWRTTDAGATWDSSGMFLPQAASEAGWNNSAMLIGSQIWFGTNNTKVYYSSNFGSNWTSSPTTGSLNGYSMHFNSPLLGLVGGTAIVKTTDGGVTYSAPITVPGSGNILGLGGDGDNFWCGRGAAIYGSTDAGATWASVFTPTGAVNAMDIIKTGSCASGWAVGATGTISRLDGTISGIQNTGSTIPSSFKLGQNYPNPFNPTTSINFSIPKSGIIELKVYDMLGREVASLINEYKSAGTYIVDFNASGLSSGVYIYRLKAENFIESKKMTLLK